ncbi:MAG: methylated-DNA--[protein]-cysteine S-methyltransferase [Gemmatimonadaceae bacterium]
MNEARACEAIENLREYIDTHLANSSDARITLDLLGRKAEMSPYHLQRKFKRLVGLTPAQYLRAQKTTRLKSEPKRGETVEIRYVVTTTSLGALLVAATSPGICAVTLGTDAKTLEALLAREYPAATRRAVSRASSPLGSWVNEIVAAVEGESADLIMPIDVRASAFQRKVWRELQKIPFGETRTYTEIAESIGSPQGVRAVATACARNRVAIVIPCHRVVRRDGELGGYRWGMERKECLIDTERAARERRMS